MGKIAKPILKWAGGKGQLLPQIIPHLPAVITSYAEPFVGSGAVFLYIAQTYQPQRLYISDANPYLILLYQVVQSRVEALIQCLTGIEQEFHQLNQQEQSNYFYAIRHQFNQLRLSLSSIHVEHNCAVPYVAWLIFLNRTCFNGLFRVNAKGDFNVPFGDYKHPKICDRANLLAVSRILQNTEIRCADFSAVSDFCTPETLIYFDPPYRPLSKTANFQAYSVHNFDDQEQIRLAELCHYLHRRGVKWLLSNSDPHNTNPADDFFDDLYHQYTILRISASRMINCDATKRGAITEILVRNY